MSDNLERMKLLAGIPGEDGDDLTEGKLRPSQVMVSISRHGGFGEPVKFFWALKSGPNTVVTNGKASSYEGAAKAAREAARKHAGWE